MKLLASALSLLAVISCSNDTDVLSQQDTPKTKQVTVTLSAEQNISDDLRAVYRVDNASSGVISGLEMPEKDVVLRIGVRRGNGGTVLLQDIRFTKTPKRNHAWYKGKITVPTEGEGEYQIVAFLTDEVDGANFLAYTEVFTDPKAVVPGYTNHMGGVPPGIKSGAIRNEIATTVVADGKITARVPYMSKWQSLKVTGDAANTTVLNLDPQGTLLRMRIHNTSDAPQTFHRVKFVSNSIYIGANFTLAWDRDGYPGVQAEPYETQTLLLPDGGVTVQPGQYSKWFYHWVMPRVTPRKDTYTIASVATAASPSLSDYSLAFSTSSTLPYGSVPVTLTYDGNHQAQFDPLPEHGDQWGATTSELESPLIYFADRVLHKDKTRFVTGLNPENASVAFFTGDEITAMSSSPINIGGEMWRIPTRDEMASLLPIEFDRTGYGVDKIASGSTVNNVLEESIKIGDVTQSYYADYKHDGTTLYGVRFKNGSNKYRTAFRYRMIQDPSTGHLSLQISTYYLGSQSVGLEEIALPHFWEVLELSGKVTSKQYPLYGLQHVFKPQNSLNKLVDLATTTTYDTGAQYVGVLTAGLRSRVMTRANSFKRVVLLIRNN